MSVRKEYEEYLKRQNKLKNTKTGKFWIEQESRYVEPFCIYGNLYYVGDSWVCVHIVDTGDGLLMFDAGNYGGEAMLIQAIWEAGFRPNDVKWIVLSHGHVDHFGAVNFFRKMFGTKICMGEPHCKMFGEKREFSMIHASGNCMNTLFPVDVEIQDGDVFEFGNTKIQFYLVPGHTEGCICCFFDITDGREKKRAGYYGGFGFNTLQKDFLQETGDSELQMRRKYLDSLKKVRNEHVDLFMGNHTSNIDLLDKRKRMKVNPKENLFLDENAWQRYLDEKYVEMQSLIKSES